MSEELDLSGLDDSSKKQFKKEVEHKIDEKKKKKQWRHDLENNPDVREYLSQFNHFGVSRFFDEYIQHKYLAYKHKKLYADLLESKRTEYIDTATEHLKVLLQKKMFDMQCLWRANQLTIDGIEIAQDFIMWEHKILDCPFLEIDEDDIELYQEFLRSGKPELFEFLIDGWQDYDSYKQTDDGSENDLPLWYEFHNLKTGNGVLSQLQDIKGEKEKFYRSLAFNSEQRPEVPPYEPDFRPYIDDKEEEVRRKVAKIIEDTESQKYIENYHKFKKISDRNLDDVWFSLNEIEEPVPVESHEDFREALEIAYKKYWFGKIAEHLPIAYNQYLFSRKMNLAASKGKYDHFYVSIREDVANHILKGRELNGEPRDFNY